jgi:hypothetical protein
LVLARKDTLKAEAMFGKALGKYQKLNEPWGLAHSSHVLHKLPRPAAILHLFQRRRPKFLRMKRAIPANAQDLAGALSAPA